MSSRHAAPLTRPPTTGPRRRYGPLSVQGKGNTDAETAMGALAAARHDFPAALRWARKATTSGPYSSSAYGVLADAHTQLGHYDEADEAVQKMTDLRPDAASLARASYAFELKGNTPGLAP
ncbi:hypothetical protein V6574_01595 [Streptomyces sp. SM1P]